MKILIIAVHFEVTGARYIADAFKQLGHDVKHIGQPARLKDAWGVEIDARWEWKPDTLESDWIPGLIILADTLVTVADVPPSFAGVPVIVWIQDNHVRNVRQAGVAHYFLAHAHGPAQPVTQADETWLPCATDASYFRQSVIPYREREYDVCIVGVMYERRARLVNKLREAGLKVFAATGLVYEAYAQAYQNSRISLCVSAAGDVAQRVFESAGMGCLVLSDPLADMLDDETNRKLGLNGFAFYWSDDECVDRAVEFTQREVAKAEWGSQVLGHIVRAQHTWKHRAQRVIDWYQETYINAPKVVTVERKPYLNLGCGKTHFPSEPPPGHEMVEAAIYQYPLWMNVDKVEGVGADKVFDLFQYPWPLEDNSFDGAVLAHIVEHIPHDIKTTDAQLSKLQDGWYAFFAELYRVLTPGAIVHIVSPYGWSDGAITDPTHTRMLTLNTFTHGLASGDSPTFKYETACNFVVDREPTYRINEIFKHLSDDPAELQRALMTRLNVCYDFYIRLKAVK